MQLFRDGVIETTDSRMIGEPAGSLPTSLYAGSLFRFIFATTQLYRRLNIQPPISIAIALLNVKGCKLGVGKRLRCYQGIDARPFDRDLLLLPDLQLESFDADDEQALARPLLDATWQAAGLSHCMQYDDKGIWKNI